jgi:hypothetical protein
MFRAKQPATRQKSERWPAGKRCGRKRVFVRRAKGN